MNKKLLALLIAATATPAVMAMTDAEIEARFQKYEDKIKSLETEVNTLKNNGGVVYVEDLDRQGKRNSKQIDDIKSRMDSESQRLKINGFMTAAVSEGDDPIDTAYEIDDSVSMAGDSKVGLQFNYKMDEKTDATVQLIARGRGQGFNNDADAWDVKAEWAYLGYKISDDLKVRAGRLRTPFYMYSETLDVGYTQPWVRPPLELYNTVLTAYDGADLLYDFSIGEVNNTLQFFTGAQASTNDNDQKETNVNVNLQDIYGINLTSNWGAWTARMMAATLAIDGNVSPKFYGPQQQVVPPITAKKLAQAGLILESTAQSAQSATGANSYTCINGQTVAGDPMCTAYRLNFDADESLDYYALGGQYDDGNLFVLAETAKFIARNASLFSDNTSGYITAGYRLGKWTPYGTYAFVYDDETLENLEENGVLPTAMQSTSLGLRRELTDSLSAKLEWNHFYDMENNGNFSDNPGDDTNVYTFALDAVF